MDNFDLLRLEFPTPQPRHEGFLDITGVQYHENTISRIYAYFMDKEKHPEIANLFLNGLLALIQKKAGAFEADLSNHKCFLEYSSKRGRIDILVGSKSDEAKDHTPFDGAIIIENKIYAWLHNDLQDYWDSVNATDKIGVLLTLTPAKGNPTGSAKFVNVTHLEWIGEIKRIGLPANLPINLYVYLNDFIMNMEKLSNHGKIDENARFFFNHADKILRATKIYDAAFDYIISSLKLVAQSLQWEVFGSNYRWRHIWDGKNQSEVYFSIVFDGMIQAEPELEIYLEVYQGACKRKAQHILTLEREGAINDLDKGTEGNEQWAHLVGKKYRVKPEEVENLSVFIREKLEKDFWPAFLLVSRAEKEFSMA